MDGSDIVRVVRAFRMSMSLGGSCTSASPEPPSTAICFSRSVTNSQFSPWFQEPRISPSPWDMLK